MLLGEHCTSFFRSLFSSSEGREYIAVTAGITFLCSFFSAAVGSACGAIGATVLTALGYDYPAVKAASALDAAGSTVIGAFAGCFILTQHTYNTLELKTVLKEGLTQAIGSQIFSGMLGNVMLSGVTSVGKAAALSTVGAGIILGGAATLGLLGSCGFWIYKSCRGTPRSIEEDQPYERATSPHSPTAVVVLGP